MVHSRKEENRIEANRKRVSLIIYQMKATEISLVKSKETAKDIRQREKSDKKKNEKNENLIWRYQLLNCQMYGMFSRDTSS